MQKHLQTAGTIGVDTPGSCSRLLLRPQPQRGSPGDCRTRLHALSDIVGISRCRFYGYSLLAQTDKGRYLLRPSGRAIMQRYDRRSVGLNVAEELRQPEPVGDTAMSPDVLVVAEHHDLPPSRARNVRHLSDRHGQTPLRRNPDARGPCLCVPGSTSTECTMALNRLPTAVSPMWESSPVVRTLDLPARGDVPRVRACSPGGSALAELAGTRDGEVQGVAADAPGSPCAPPLLRQRAYERRSPLCCCAGALFGSSSAAALRAPQSPHRCPPRSASTCKRWRGNLLSRTAGAANAALRRDMATCRSMMQEDVADLM